MDKLMREIVTDVARAFSAESGPACEALETLGEAWYEFEGRKLEKALLNLDPIDLQIEDLECENSRMLRWASDGGLKWLIPGLVRLAFEEKEKSCGFGDAVLNELSEELERRAGKKNLVLSRDQMRSLLHAFDAFYTAEEFGWNPDSFETPYVRRMKSLLD